jgi:hypothetical protein
MRQHKALVLVLLILIALSMLPMQAASAQATFTECVAELPLVSMEEGVVTFPGPNMHIRGRVVWFEQTSDNPLCAGSLRVVVNYNLNADGKGPKWGTWSWVADGETYTGGFEGTFTGWAWNYTFSSWVEAVGRGYGDLSGLRVRESIDFTEIIHGYATATILDPHGE